MLNASPHMRIILSNPPYAYGDQFLMCPCGVSDLLLSHALNPNFLHASAHTPIFLHASAHAQTSNNTTSTRTNIKKNTTIDHSPFAFRDLLTPHLHLGIITPLWKMASGVPALRDLDNLDGVPALPKFPQQAPLKNSTGNCVGNRGLGH
jgi:hypothetical protein